MNILNNLLKTKKHQATKPESTPNFNEKIKEILLILENLAFLNKEEITEILKKKNITYNHVLLDKLIIDKSRDTYPFLRNNLLKENLGYQEEKLLQIKKLLETVNNEEDLIFKAKLEISKYEKILEDLNQILKSLHENKKLTIPDKIALTDYWINNFKETKLGSKINLANKVKDYLNALKSLEYNGLGPDKLLDFQATVKEIIEKNKNNPTSETLKLLEKAYKNLVDKYIHELEILKKRLSLIDNSNELNLQAKLEKKEEFIIDFKLHNGHPLDLNTNIAVYKENLTTLKYGGYKNEALEEFLKKATTIINFMKDLKIKDKLILVKLNLLYQDYLNNYNKEVEILEKEIATNPTKELYLIEHFEEKFGHDINLDIRIKELIERLTNQITTEEVIDYFREKVVIITEKDQAPSKKLLEIDNLSSLILKDSLDVSLSKLNEKIVYYKNSLASLENNGYNKEALKEFLTAAYDVLYSSHEITEKTLIIDKLYRNLVEEYYFNLQVYTIWKEERLNLGESKNYLTKEINHLLTLSRKDLAIYLDKDDKLKRENMEKHNLFLTVKHLALKEANQTKNPNLLKKRLEDLEKGINPYTQEELLKAKEELEEKEYLDIEGKIPTSEKLITMADYIDSTLYKQIVTIKTSLEKNKI